MKGIILTVGEISARKDTSRGQAVLPPVGEDLWNTRRRCEPGAPGLTARGD